MRHAWAILDEALIQLEPVASIWSSGLVRSYVVSSLQHAASFGGLVRLLITSLYSLLYELWNFPMVLHETSHRRWFFRIKALMDARKQANLRNIIIYTYCCLYMYVCTYIYIYIYTYYCSTKTKHVWETRTWWDMDWGEIGYNAKLKLRGCIKELRY